MTVCFGWFIVIFQCLIRLLLSRIYFRQLDNSSLWNVDGFVHDVFVVWFRRLFSAAFCTSSDGYSSLRIFHSSVMNPIEKAKNHSAPHRSSPVRPYLYVRVHAQVGAPFLCRWSQKPFLGLLARRMLSPPSPRRSWPETPKPRAD